MTSATGYTVSTADLAGFGDQIHSLSGYYEHLKKVVHGWGFAGNFAMSGNGSGNLHGALALFAQDAHDLMMAQVRVCERLGPSLAGLDTKLKHTAGEYAKQDRHAARQGFASIGGIGDPMPWLPSERGGGGGPSAGLAPACPGGPLHDWRTRLDLQDYLKKHTAGEYLSQLKMDYQIKLDSATNVLDSVTGETLGTLDSLLQSLIGMSIVKIICMPLLGNWAALWSLRDMYAETSNAAKAAADLLGTGSRNLRDGCWSGAAATAFYGHLNSWHGALNKHAESLRKSSELMGGIADTINRDATEITKGIAVIVQVLLGVVTAPTRAVALGSLAKGGIRSVVMKAKKVIVMGYRLGEAVDAAATSTTGLCEEADAIMPPRSGK